MGGSRPSLRQVLGDARGVTLMEMVVAATILTIVLGGIYLVLVSNQSVYARGQVSFDMHTNAHLSLPIITGLLLGAGLDPTQQGTFGFVDNPDAGYVPVVSNTQVTFTLDANGDGVLQNNAEERNAFRRAGAGPPYTLERMVIDGAGTVSWQAVAQQIQNLRFSYFDAGGNPLPNPPTPPYTLSVAQRQLIRRITVEVTVAQTGTGFLRGRAYTYKVSSDVAPRNLGGS